MWSQDGSCAKALLRWILFHSACFVGGGPASRALLNLRRYNLDVHLMNRTIFDSSCSVLMSCALSATTSAQSNPQLTPAPAPPAAQGVPVIDGAVGPCSVEFTVTTADRKPAGAATVKVHIAADFTSSISKPAPIRKAK
jgi:hypothetical protein